MKDSYFNRNRFGIREEPDFNYILSEVMPPHDDDAEVFEIEDEDWKMMLRGMSVACVPTALKVMA